MGNPEAMTFLRTPDRNIDLAWLRKFIPQVVGVIDTSLLSRGSSEDPTVLGSDAFLCTPKSTLMPPVTSGMTFRHMTHTASGANT